jgi:hypothetical protein
MTNFKIERAFLIYLKMLNIEPKELSVIQMVEIKRAFYAGCDYIFKTLESTANLPSEEEAVFVWKNFEYQINEFFKVEIEKPSKLNYL